MFSNFCRRQAVNMGKSQSRNFSAGTESSAFTITVPKIGLAVGLSALSFQLIVLYPWHPELGQQLSELQTCVAELDQSNKKMYTTIEQLQKGKK